MLKSNIKETVYTIPMPVKAAYMVISYNKDKFHKEMFIITSITEKEYDKLKRGDGIKIIRGEQNFDISSDDVLCFGEIDFHNGSEDCETLDTFNWLDHLGVQGVGIPSRYDYDKHECTSPMKHCLYTETFKISALCRYLHGCLGKPKYTLIFREIQ